MKRCVLVMCYQCPDNYGLCHEYLGELSAIVEDCHSTKIENSTKEIFNCSHFETGKVILVTRTTIELLQLSLHILKYLSFAL